MTELSGLRHQSFPVLGVVVTELVGEAVNISDGLQDDVQLRHVLLDAEAGQELVQSGMLGLLCTTRYQISDFLCLKSIQY